MSTIKDPSYFNNFATFFEKGIEILLVNNRPHRVFRSSKTQLWLLPIISASDEAAKDKYNSNIQNNQQ